MMRKKIMSQKYNEAQRNLEPETNELKDNVRTKKLTRWKNIEAEA